MYKYTIYCTEEQTKMALELGAPLFRLYGTGCSGYIDMLIISDTEAYTIPTAEQMIGWLEDIMPISEEFSIKQIIVERYFDGSWNYFIGIKESEAYYPSRKEATLAAIDAALEYLLIKNKKL